MAHLTIIIEMVKIFAPHADFFKALNLNEFATHLQLLFHLLLFPATSQLHKSNCNRQNARHLPLQSALAD